MRAKAAAAVLAAIMLCGCTVTPQAEKNNNKPVAKEYEEEQQADPEVQSVHIENDNKDIEYGGPLVYSDFTVGDFNFLEDKLNDKQCYYAYNYWEAYDENGERYRDDLNFFMRTPAGYTPDDIEQNYGGEAQYVSFDEDKIWQYAKAGDHPEFLKSIEHAAVYYDYKYPLPADSGRLGQYAGIRFYFDGSGSPVLVVMYLNDDIMPIHQVVWDTFTFRDNYEKYSPKNCTLVPKLMLVGMENYHELPADEAFPVLKFGEGSVKVECKKTDGSTADGEGVLKTGAKFGYLETDDTVEFDLPEGADSMTTYLSYNRYLDAFELHDPYWHDKYGCTLLMYKAK